MAGDGSRTGAAQARSSGAAGCTAPPRRAGRPRDRGLDLRFLEAALDALAENGFEGVSLEDVARRAGSTRPAIYRRWTGREALLLDAVRHVFRKMDEHAAAALDAGNRSVRAAVKGLLATASAELADERQRRIFVAVISAMHRHPAWRDLHGLIHGRRGIVLRRMLEAGVARGELAPAFDVETAIDLLMGPIFYRGLILGLPMAGEEVDRLVDAVLGTGKEAPLREAAWSPDRNESRS